LSLRHCIKKTSRTHITINSGDFRVAIFVCCRSEFAAQLLFAGRVGMASTGPECVKTHESFNSLKYWLHRKPHIERSPFPNGFGAPENLLILNFHTAWAESTRSRQVHSINSMYSRSAGLHGLSSHGLNEGLVYLESVKRTENPS